MNSKGTNTVCFTAEHHSSCAQNDSGQGKIKAMQQIDIHTHQVSKEGNIQILNIFAQDLPGSGPECFFSAGLHPWHVGKVNDEECFLAVEQAAKLKNMLAVGECGLDRSVQEDFALQEICFKKQIRIAGENDRPLIIHCVRAYSDLQKFKKETKSDVPWIIHGYGGNSETTLSLIRHGFYFSVGEPFLKDKRKHVVLRTIPIEQLFLETDDSEISIGKIYSFAAQILNVEEELLEERITQNFTNLFGDDKLIINI